MFRKRGLIALGVAGWGPTLLVLVAMQIVPHAPENYLVCWSNQKSYLAMGLAFVVLIEMAVVVIVLGQGRILGAGKRWSTRCSYWDDWRQYMRHTSRILVVNIVIGYIPFFIFLNIFRPFVIDVFSLL